MVIGETEGQVSISEIRLHLLSKCVNYLWPHVRLDHVASWHDMIPHDTDQVSRLAGAGANQSANKKQVSTGIGRLIGHVSCLLSFMAS